MDSTPKPNLPEAVGPYRLEDLLGRGGMGEVYRAYDTRLGRRVAIKHIRPEAELQRTTHERFRREASTVAKLSHPAIVQIFDVLDTEDGDWIVMEYIDGPTLTSMVARGPLGLDRALTYGRQVAEGLAEAHEKGVLHRDLKTENVMVTPSGHAKILDFGLAKQLDADSGEQTLTRGGEIMGTGRAMSPEQARGLELGPRSDLFSLGVLLYELLTGRPPFRGDTMLDTLTQLVSSHQAPVNELAPSVPGELSDLVDRLLEKAPELRPQSARQVAAKLEEIRMRHVSGASVVVESTDYAGATTFVSDSVTATPGPHVETHPSDSIFRKATAGRTLAVFGSLAVLLVIVLGWSVLSTHPEAPIPSESRQPLEPRELTEATTASEALEIGQEHLRHYDSGSRLEQAVAALKAATTKGPDSAPAHAELAYAYWRKYLFASNDPIWLEQAEALARKATELEPFYGRAWVSLGLAQVYLGEYDEAAEAIERALVLDPRDSRALVAQAKLAEKTSQRDAAADAYSRALDFAPEDREVLDSAAVFEMRQGHLELAEGLLKRSIEAHPRGVFAHINLSTLYYLQTRYELATEVIQELIRFHQSPTAYSNLGTYLFYQGLYNDSAEAFRRATEFDLGSNSYLVWANLGDAQRWAGRSDDASTSYQRARGLVRKQLETSPADLGLRSHLALLLAKSGETEKSAASIRDLTAAAGETRDPRIPARLAQAAEIAGRRDLALELLRVAIERSYPLKEIERDPELTRLRADPRFHDLRPASADSD